MAASSSVRPSPYLATEDYTVCDLGSLQFRTEKVICNWTILNYNTWPRDVHGVKSPSFSHPGSTKWCMELVKIQNNQGWALCFHLLSSQNNPSVSATVKASLISSSGTKYDVYPPTIVRLNSPTATGHVNVGNFFNRESDFQDVLKFQGEVSIPSAMSEACQNVVPHRKLQSDTDDLAAKLETLLDSGDHSDVVLCVGDKELRAHKAVLSARSPVFAAILRHDNIETQTGRIKIEDVNLDTLHELLLYIYTGKVHLLEKMADKLLVAADKYDLPLLKQLCEVEMGKKLTVDNAAATAVISLSHSCDLLTSFVVSFIKKNVVHVLGSDGWADSVAQHPEIIMELGRLIADKSTE